MLNFIHKYQKSIYIVITVVIALSFTVSGSSRLQSSKKVAVAFKAFNGVKISSDEVQLMRRFLEKDHQDQLASAAPYGGNFLNKDFLSQSFFKNGFFEQLYSAHGSSFKEQLEAKRAKEQAFALYTYPQLPFIGLQSVYQQVAPQALTSFTLLKNAENPLDKQAIKARVQLFEVQKKWPAEHLKKILYNQQLQMGVTVDPSLQNKSLTFFNYKNLDDWFGIGANQLLIEAIFEGSELAKEKGYVVSKEEAEADLLWLAQDNLKTLVNHGALPASLTKEAHIKEQLRYLGISYKECVLLWQRVLAFRRYVDALQNSLVLAPTIEKEFLDFAEEKRYYSVYKLKDDLQIKDFADFQLLNTYFSYVDKEYSLEKMVPPTQYFSVEELEGRAKDLLVSRYNVQVKEVFLGAINPFISLKDLWSYEVGEGWDSIKEAFSLGDVEKEGRLAALHALDREERGKLDYFTALHRVKSDERLIAEALVEVPFKEKEIEVTTDTSHFLLDKEENREEILALLEHGGEKTFFVGKEKVFCVKVHKESFKRSLLSFKEAKKKEILSKLLEERLGGQDPQEFFAQALENIRSLAGDQKVDQLVKWTFVNYMENRDLLVKEEKVAQRNAESSLVFSLKEGEKSAVHPSESGTLQAFLLNKISLETHISQEIALLEKSKEYLVEPMKGSYYKVLIDKTLREGSISSAIL
jgi:hypothetical protein